VWATLATASLSGLAILGACSDNPVASTKPEAVNLEPRFGIVGGTAHKVMICVDLSSSPGPLAGGKYAFAVTKSTVGVFPFPTFETQLDNDPVPYFGISVQNSPGPFRAGVDNDVVTAAPQVAPGECVAAFERANTCAGGVCTDQPSSHLANRIWTCDGTWCSGIINPYASVNITGTTPPGYTFDGLSCINDDPSNPQSCVNGGYSSANVFHGSTFTYKFSAPQELPCPAGSFTTSIAGAAHVDGWPDGGVGDLLIKYDQFPAPNDNSYGDNSIGWKPNRPHRFKDLVNSDHAGILLKNPAGQTRLSFDMDYLTASASAPSGYKSLGVTGGDGQMRVGTADGISVTTSLANNLNNINIPGLFNAATHVQLIGSVNVKEDSPPTDPAHQTYNITDAALAGWDFHNTYYARISLAKLTALGFNAATWTVAPNASALHNSPPKACPNVAD